MNTDVAFHRAQVYRFLADAFLYPTENWLEDAPLLMDILLKLDVLQSWDLDASREMVPRTRRSPQVWDLPALQAEHRRSFGLTGSLFYETEVGLPHEFRQSQELADIAGFYRAFGFSMGGSVRERPDHLAAELEFMHVLALKEVYAAQNEFVEAIGICADAQGKFLQDHLGKWIDLFAEALSRSAAEGPYVALARFTAGFVQADARRLGAKLEPRQLGDGQPTPLPVEMSCEVCPIAE